MSKRAVILAGGKGTRLKPYTVVFPKPLMPIGDYPILEIVVRQLVYYGFDHITIAVNHHRELIQAFFGDGSKWNAKIDYSFEDKPLSTMGPLTLIPDLPDNFLIMNGDILTDLNYNKLYDYHLSNNNNYTICSYKREQISEFGVLETDDNNTLIGFREKPINYYQVSMGIYFASKQILEHIPYNEAYGFDELMLKLIKANTPPSVWPFDGYWLDIGRADDYAKASEQFEKLQSTFLK